MSETSSEQQDPQPFVPKYIYSNFRGSNLDIEPEHDVIEPTEPSHHHQTDIIFHPIVGGHLNFTSQEDDDDDSFPGGSKGKPTDTGEEEIPSDIYLTLVIVSVSLIVLVLLSYALYKAVRMLKVSLNDGREDSLPVPASGLRRPGLSHSHNGHNHTTASVILASPQPMSAVSSVAHLAVPPMPSTSAGSSSPPRRTTVSLVSQAQTSFIQGIRNFHPPIFSTLTRRHEEDQPPPYDEPSPPPYHIAIQMRPPNFDDGFKLDPIKINQTSRIVNNTGNSSTRTGGEFDSISLESGDVTDGIKKYVSVAIVV